MGESRQVNLPQTSAGWKVSGSADKRPSGKPRSRLGGAPSVVRADEWVESLFRRRETSNLHAATYGAHVAGRSQGPADPVPALVPRFLGTPQDNRFVSKILRTVF